VNTASRGSLYLLTIFDHSVVISVPCCTSKVQEKHGQIS